MLLRKTFPRIRSVQVKVQPFYQVDARKQGTVGKRETFANRRDAERRAADIAAELSANGAETLALPLEVRVMAMTCTKSGGDKRSVATGWFDAMIEDAFNDGGSSVPAL